MSFPACRHAKRKPKPGVQALVWLGSEPYRLFFLSGILFCFLFGKTKASSIALICYEHLCGKFFSHFSFSHFRDFKSNFFSFTLRPFNHFAFVIQVGAHDHI